MAMEVTLIYLCGNIYPMENLEYLKILIIQENIVRTL